MLSHFLDTTLEHIAHAAEHGGAEHQNPAHHRLSMYAGITMAVLEVVRRSPPPRSETILVKIMVEQEDAHIRYVTQDLKHRVAVISLRQLRATLPAAATKSLDAKEMVALDKKMQRYYTESQAASAWSDAYAIEAHVEGQEYYEWGMLCAEIGR